MFVVFVLSACRSYLDSVAEEIGDQLQENGVVTIADLAKTYDLPGEFLSEVACIEWPY